MKKHLRIVEGDYKSKFSKLLEKNGSFSIHHRDIQTLSIEVFKFFNEISPNIMNEVFQVKPPVPYYLRDKNELYSRNSKTMTYGTESFWSTVPKKLKKSLYSFKKTYKEMETKLSMSVKITSSIFVLYNKHVWY